MKNKLVSIIIPLYNCEKYIEKCLNSLIKQTYRNIEIIVVDDGSKDSSLSVCKELSKKDKRIKVFPKKNGGVSSARNYGISKANGYYLCFVDADDWVDEKYCESLVTGYDKNIDLSVVGIGASNRKNIEVEETKIINKNEAFVKMFNDNNFFGYPVNKLYLKSIVDSIGKKPFDENIYYCEDTLFNAKYLEKCKKNIYFNTKKMYTYFIRDDSATNIRKLTEKNYTVFKALEGIENIIKKNKVSGLEELYIFYLYNYYRLYVTNQISKSGLKLNEIRKKDIYKYIMKSKKISYMKKIKIAIKFYFPMLNYYLNNAIK